MNKYVTTDTNKTIMQQRKGGRKEGQGRGGEGKRRGNRKGERRKKE